jgi:hypothetical protein
MSIAGIIVYVRGQHRPAKRRESPRGQDCGGEGVRKMEPALAVVECQNPVGYCN